MNERESCSSAYLLSITICLFLISAFATDASAQLRPRTIDEGPVEIRTRKAGMGNRIPRVSNSAPRATTSLLIVQTDPDDAEIRIDGKVQGKAINGIFLKQLLSRRQYNVEVSAGADYEPYKKIVSLKPGQYEVVEADLVAKYGVVRIGPALEGAEIRVDERPLAPDKMRIDKESNTIVVTGLTPGQHKVTYDHPDFAIVERSFDIEPGIEYTRMLNLERSTTDLLVATEPNTRVYLDNEQIGETTGEGNLKRSDIRLGRHEIRLIKYGYAEHKETLSFSFRKPVVVERRLEPLPTSASFQDDFEVASANRWLMPPSGVSVRSGRLRVEGAQALAIPKEIWYRDFTMHFHLKIEGRGGAAWAVRVKDSNNYYLFHLSGPQDRIPNRFLTYIVRDGKFDPMTPDESFSLIEPLTPDGQYEIDVIATKNRIVHSIKSAATGKSEPVGVFEDRNNVFHYGGVGFRSVGSERFSIDDFFVQPR